jgi:hypothetical protein
VKRSKFFRVSGVFAKYTERMGLKKGMKVEIRSNEEGYEGAWFEGIVKTISRRKGSCKIHLEKFVTDEGEPLVEKVRLSNVRPIPPHRRLPLPLFEGLSVEAYDKDCWWRGFIFEKVCCKKERWLVYFPDTKTFEAYPLSAFRPAQECERGNWTLVPPV